MKFWDKAKKAVDDAKKEVDEKVSDKLVEEELNPTLRQSKDEPLKAVEDKKGKSS